MKPIALYSENIELSSTTDKIILDQNQIYFLENYLKSKVPGLSITSGFKLIDGRLIFEVAIRKNDKSFNHGLQEIIDYLIIFDQQLRTSSLTNVMVKIKRWNSFQGSMHTPLTLRRQSFF